MGSSLRCTHSESDVERKKEEHLHIFLPLDKLDDRYKIQAFSHQKLFSAWAVDPRTARVTSTGNYFSSSLLQ